jgi:hypothetical protein
MPRPPRPVDPATPAGAAAPWAADEARAEPAPAPRVRRARLRSRVKALLTARLKRRGEPPAPGGEGSSGSSWPDSFFGP